MVTFLEYVCHQISRFLVTFIHKDMSVVRLHYEKTGLETREIFHYGTNMKASSALEMFWFPRISTKNCRN